MPRGPAPAPRRRHGLRPCARGLIQLLETTTAYPRELDPARARLPGAN
ncbi:MAG: hypothetical protein R3C69_01985 [Geminicoccaceae bacterium]